MKRSIVLSLILAICCLLPFTASAEEWSDFFALNEETAIGYDEALASTMKCGRGRMKSTSGRPSARRMGRACMLTRSNSA